MSAENPLPARERLGLAPGERRCDDEPAALAICELAAGGFQLRKCSRIAGFEHRGDFFGALRERAKCFCRMPGRGSRVNRSTHVRDDGSGSCESPQIVEASQFGEAIVAGKLKRDRRRRCSGASFVRIENRSLDAIVRREKPARKRAEFFQNSIDRTDHPVKLPAEKKVLSFCLRFDGYARAVVRSQWCRHCSMRVMGCVDQIDRVRERARCGAIIRREQRMPNRLKRNAMLQGDRADDRAVMRGDLNFRIRPATAQENLCEVAVPKKSVPGRVPCTPKVEIKEMVLAAILETKSRAHDRTFGKASQVRQGRHTIGSARSRRRNRASLSASHFSSVAKPAPFPRAFTSQQSGDFSRPKARTSTS